jgi:uncharacterized protein YjbI with pentapeptide repeats
MPTTKQYLTYAQTFAKGLQKDSPHSLTILGSAWAFHYSLRTGGPAIGKMLRGRPVTRREATAVGAVILNGAYLVGGNLAKGRMDQEELRHANLPKSPNANVFDKVTSEKVGHPVLGAVLADPFANLSGLMKGFFDE